MKTLRYFLHKTFWFFANPIRTVYRFIVRPVGKGVKVLIKHNDRFLLVRPTYAHKLWSVPGGGVDRNETYEQAGRREVKEETGLVLDTVIPIGEYTHTQNYKTVTVKVFLATTSQNEVTVDGIEIKEARWVTLDTLPEDRVSRVDRIIDFYKARYSA